MKQLFLIVALLTNMVYCQSTKNHDWVELLDKEITSVNVTAKTQKFKVGIFYFEPIWDSKQNYSNNIGYYGGIKTMKIYRDNKFLNSVGKIEDVIALGEIYFEFYDYNFDGYIDFSVPIDSGKGIWKKYYLFNKELQQFRHFKEWDGIRIDEINKSKKQLKSTDSYNAVHGSIYTYQINGYNLKLIEKKDY